MNKDNIIKDKYFRRACVSYNIDSQDFSIVENTIVLKSPKENIVVLLDENYNTIGICDKNDVIVTGITTEKIVKAYRDLYESSDGRLPEPFQDLSLKQLVDICDRVNIYSTNHGHSSQMLVNGETVNDEYGNVYVSLLSYIRFLGEMVYQYYINLYQFKMMELEYPDVYQYINGLVSNIDQCIDSHISKDERPFPVDILRYLGIDSKQMEQYDHELYGTIDLLLHKKGKKIVGGYDHYKELEDYTGEIGDLRSLSNDLLKILEVTKEEVEERYIKSCETFETNEVNLESFLSKKNDKSLTLTNSKND